MQNTGFIFHGNNTSDALKQLWEAIERHGTQYKGQKGTVKSIKAVTLIIDDPLNETKNYPYWSKLEDDWYQDNFVRKETNDPPEQIQAATSEVDTQIFPYKYAWRSRYYDLGYGHLKALVTILKRFKIYDLPAGKAGLRFKNKKQLTNLLLTTYKLIHPEILLAVLSWKGSKLINFYLKNPQVLDQELSSNRTDTLLKVIEELRKHPNSRRAITPSFIYPQIDHSGGAGGIPVYQNYQLYINFDKGKPKSLTSFHLHRAFDAYGGLQLDINHDKEWGLIASKKLGLPLEKMVIYGNDVWAGENNSKKDIRSWLLAATNSYDPKVEDMEKRLSSESYKRKIEFTWRKFSS